MFFKLQCSASSLKVQYRYNVTAFGDNVYHGYTFTQEVAIKVKKVISDFKS